jgi:tellurite resistance protein TerC
MDRLALSALRHARRVIILVVGATVLLLGIALLVLPGPAFVVIPVGLGILAIEFAWAKRWLAMARDVANNMKSRVGSALESIETQR